MLILKNHLLFKFHKVNAECRCRGWATKTEIEKLDKSRECRNGSDVFMEDRAELLKKNILELRRVHGRKLTLRI